MTTLLIDVESVCNPIFFARPVLFRNNDPQQGRAETIDGFLKWLIRMLEDFEPCTAAFFFDSENSRRKELLPTYKIRRQENRAKVAGTSKDKKFLDKQLSLLRRHVLPELGFTNVFQADGYEADDLISGACVWVNCCGGDAVIVSADKDFFQLLGPYRTIYNPSTKRHWTERAFEKEYGIYPYQWVEVKAIAGCVSDDIPGVEGVGEVSALKWAKGDLDRETTMGRRIVAGEKIIKRNKKLILLPYPGTPPVEIKPCEMVWSRWPRVLEKIGIEMEVPGGEEKARR